MIVLIVVGRGGSYACVLGLNSSWRSWAGGRTVSVFLVVARARRSEIATVLFRQHFRGACRAAFRGGGLGVKTYYGPINRPASSSIIPVLGPVLLDGPP